MIVLVVLILLINIITLLFLMWTMVVLHNMVQGLYEKINNERV